MVDKEYAICVVDLVLEDTCQKSFSCHSELMPILVQGFDSYLRIPWHLTIDIFYAKATLKIFFNSTFEFCNKWVNKGCKRCIFLVVIVITDNNYSKEFIDLNCCERNTDF